jgi:HTH-type transcriptional regulator/antitoxin HigA
MENKKTAKLYPCDFDWEPTPPGETLLEMLEQQHITKDILASKLGYSDEETNSFIAGQIPITPEIAVLLEQLVGTSADCWLKLEASYQDRKVQWETKQKTTQQRYSLQQSTPSYNVVSDGLLEIVHK